jgi:hypothetical protein
MERFRTSYLWSSVVCLTWASVLIGVQPASGQTQVPSCEIRTQEGARLNNSSTSSGDLGAVAADSRLILGRKVFFDDNTSVSGAFVRLGNGANVFDLEANDVVQGKRVTVRGMLSTFSAGGAFCAAPVVECGGPDVSVPKKHAKSLTPGTYGQVTLGDGASLSLAGTYNVCQIRTGKHATIDITGATTINVRDEVRISDGSTFTPGASTPTPFLNVAGDKVQIGRHATVQAFITAPSARLVLGDGTNFTGAACVRELSAGMKVSISCAPEAPTTTTSSSTTSTTGATTSTTAASTTSTTGATTSTTAASTTSTTGATTSTTAASTTSTTGATTTTTSSTSSTTSVTTTSTTSSTTPTTLFTTLAFTNSPGTTNCGSGGLVTGPSAPLSGEIDSDLACTTKISDLGLGCLYIGGGGATAVPPGATPDGATNIFDISGPNNAATLSASSGTSNLNCTKGAGPTSHCIGSTMNGVACTADSTCGGAAGSCALDANCFFAAPLPIVNAGLSTCVINVIQTDGSGTADLTAGTSSVSIPLSSRVYITGNSASPCPKCVSGTCTYGANAGGACSAGANTLLTSQDCPPVASQFTAPLPVTLNPLSTGSSKLTGTGGNFCPSPPAVNPQRTNGAFGKAAAQCIQEVGAPAGNLLDGNPHPSKLAAAFCIPQTGNPAIDPAADLPGPGAFSITGNAQALH